jgi:ElaA protein
VIRYHIKTFENISKKELYRLLKFRQEIFIVEQQSPYLDADDLDQTAIHFMGYSKGELVAYARLQAPEDLGDPVKFSRLLVAPELRGAGEGKRLVSELIQYAETNFPKASQEASAQSQLIDYYKLFDFQPIGKEYDDGGIPHRKIIRHPAD